MPRIEGSEGGHAILRASGQGEIIEALGVRIEVKATARETGGQLSVFEYVAPPGFPGPPPHHHGETEESFLVLDGELEVFLEGETRTLGTGGYAHVAPGFVHTWSNPTEAPTRFLLVFSPGGFEGYFRELAEMVEAAESWPPEDPSQVTKLAQRYDTYEQR